MLYRKRQTMHETTQPAKVNQDRLQQMRQPGHLFTQTNMMNTSNYSQRDHQLIDTSLVRKIQSLNSVEHDLIQRKYHVRDQMVSNKESIHHKHVPATISPRMDQANYFSKTKKFGLVRTDARMNAQSPFDGGNCKQEQNKRKYRWQKQKKLTSQREKHGLQVLLRLVREQYQGYREATQQMLEEKHQIAEELRGLQEQITSMGRTISSKNSQIQCYERQNQAMCQQIAQLKSLLSQEKQQESLLLYQLGCPDNHQLKVHICNKDEQIQLLKNANNEIRLTLQELSGTNRRLTLEIQQCADKNFLQNLEIVANLNKSWEQKVLELQTKIQLKELSQVQSTKLYELEVSSLKQQFRTGISNLESDLRLSQQEATNLERLSELLKAQNQGWAFKNLHLQKVIMQQYDQKRLLDDLQIKLQEAGESNLQKNETIDTLSMTIEKYLSDIEQLTQHHQTLTQSLDGHKKIQQEYRLKYEKLQQMLGNNMKSLENNLHVGDDPALVEMAQSYGYQGDNKISDWIQQQLSQTNDLIQANTKLKRTLNSLNREIEDKWIKEKIMDMQQIQKLREIVLKKDQLAQKDSRLLDTIREQSKDEHSFDSFVHKLISIKRNLVGLTGIKSGGDTLSQGQETLDDLDQDIQNEIKNVQRYLLELVNQIQTLEGRVSILTKDTEELQQANSDLREQVSTMNTFILQKQQFIRKLQKQKICSKYSYTQNPFEYSLESKRSIEFRLERDSMFASMDGLQQKRANIRVAMQELIGQYFQFDNGSLCPMIQELFVSIYQLNQSRQILTCFEMFLESVQMYNDADKKRRKSITGVVGKLIRQSQELIESDEEQVQENLILDDY